MKKFFLITLAVIGIPVAVFAVWILVEAAVMTMADADYDEGDYAGAMEKWRLVSNFSISSQAETEIGKLYLEGKGVEKDEEEATIWFTRAADNYDLEGIYYLGMQYNLGRGAPLDYEKAARYLGQAAEFDHGAAQFFLANMYMNGQGVSKDPREGERLLVLAVANGDFQVRNGLKAFYLLGLWKADADSELHDPVEAYKWLLLAATGGDREADELLTELDKVYAEDVAGEANTRAVQWMRDNIEVD
jgi:TPR repeat protein